MGFGLLKIRTARVAVNTWCIVFSVFIIFTVFIWLNSRSNKGVVKAYFNKTRQKTNYIFTDSNEGITKMIGKIRIRNCRLRLGGDRCMKYEMCERFGNHTGTNCFRRLPRCIIIGSYKSGTRELIDFLSMHPLITIRKFPSYEVAFFDRNVDKGLAWYKDQMPYSLPDQVTMEKSPSYFASEQTPRRIHEMNDSIQLIVVVREPVARAISHFSFETFVAGKQYGGFMNNCMLDPLTTKINQNCFATKYSLYDEHMKRYMNFFKLNQILVIDSNDFQSNPYYVLKKVEQFLKIDNFIKADDFVLNEDKGFYCIRDGNRSVSAACYDVTRGKKTRYTDTIQKNLRQKLREFFKPHNERLFELIGRRFAWE